MLASDAGRRHPRRFTDSTAALLAPLNSTIIAVALPSIARVRAARHRDARRVTAYLFVTIVAQSPAGSSRTLGHLARLTSAHDVRWARCWPGSPQSAVLVAGRVLCHLGALSIPTVFAARTAPPEKPAASSASRRDHERRRTVSYRRRSQTLRVAIPCSRERARRAAVLSPRAAYAVPRLHRARKPLRVLGSVISNRVLCCRIEGREHRLSLERSPRGCCSSCASCASVSRLDVRSLPPAFAAGSAIVGLQSAMYRCFLLPFSSARRSRRPRRTHLCSSRLEVLARIGDASDASARAPSRLRRAARALGAALFVTRGELVSSVIYVAGIGIPAAVERLGPQRRPRVTSGVASAALSTMRYAGGVIWPRHLACSPPRHARRPAPVLVPRVLFIPRSCAALAGEGALAPKACGAVRRTASPARPRSPS